MGVGASGWEELQSCGSESEKLREWMGKVQLENWKNWVSGWESLMGPVLVNAGRYCKKNNWTIMPLFDKNFGIDVKIYIYLI